MWNVGFYLVERSIVTLSWHISQSSGRLVRDICVKATSNSHSYHYSHDSILLQAIERSVCIEEHSCGYVFSRFGAPS